MDFSYEAGTPFYVTTSGTGIIGTITGKPCILIGALVGACSSPTVHLFDGPPTAAVTMAMCTMTSNSFIRLPFAAKSGVGYTVGGLAGDGVLRLTFFWVPGQGT